jgi:hypothetical protein
VLDVLPWQVSPYGLHVIGLSVLVVQQKEVFGFYVLLEQVVSHAEQRFPHLLLVVVVE